jgi:hypothetical protein
MLSKPLEKLPTEIERPPLGGTQGMSRPERRRRVRSQVHWRVCFFREQAYRVETTTENLSSSGFHCFSPVPLTAGDLMTCVLSVPSHQPLNNGRSLFLECKVRVVRVDPADERHFHGVACQIEDYRFTFGSDFQVSSHHLSAVPA